LGVTEGHLSLADASGIAKDGVKLPEGDLGLQILNAAGDTSKDFCKEICLSILFAICLTIVL
jgi:hypothetical protein